MELTSAHLRYLLAIYEVSRTHLDISSRSIAEKLGVTKPSVVRILNLLMITADHGCDPSYTKTTDHTREYVPYLVCGKGVKAGTDLGTKLCFGTIAQTICEYLDVDASSLDGKSVWNEIKA